MSERCVYCDGGGRLERHHLTGRDTADGVYLDAELTLPLCVRCHRGEHSTWRAAEIDGDADLRIVLVRLASTFRGLAARNKPLTVPPWFFAALADCLARLVNLSGGLS